MADRPKQISLTARELSILEHIAKGRTTHQIADALCLSPETIKWYRKRMLSKFSSSTSAEMVHNAIGLGLLEK